MSAMERFTSLDQMLAEVREEHRLEIEQKDTRIQTLQIENELLRAQNTDSRNAEKVAERFATKLLTQFALVEKIFADVKAQAVSTLDEDHGEEPITEQPGETTGAENSNDSAYTDERNEPTEAAPPAEPNDYVPVPPLPEHLIPHRETRSQRRLRETQG